LGLKPKWVRFQFYWKMSVHEENWPKSKFYLLETHIRARLEITVLYIIFWGFKIWFYGKMSIHGKNKPKYVSHPREAHFLSRLDVLVMYVNFKGFWKISSFGSKLKGVMLSILPNTHYSWWKLVKNLYFIHMRLIFLHC
jgi:hypothetical protein